MLEYGMRANDEVERLQRSINACRTSLSMPPIAVDGDFYNETYEAVCALQRHAVESGLLKPDGTPFTNADIDGIAGPDTQAIISRLQPVAPGPQLLAGSNADMLVRPEPVRDPRNFDWVPGVRFSPFDLPNFRMPEFRLPVLNISNDMEPATGAPVYAAGSVTLPPTDRSVALRPAPQAPVAPAMVPRPRGPLQITAEDIVPQAQIAEVMARAGIKPEKRAQFEQDLNALVEDINDESKINLSMRGAVARSIGQMYRDGYPVKFNDRRRDMTGRDKERPVSTAVTLDLDLEPLRSGTRFNRDHMDYFTRVMNDNGLTIERGRHGLHVELEDMNMEELREAAEAANGGKHLKPISPVQGPYRLLSEYGMRQTPRGLAGRWFTRSRKQEMHCGLDFAPETVGAFGDEIVATMPGRVTFAGQMGGYGNVVEILDIYGEKHRFAHLDRIEVEVGDVVQQGERVAMMGRTGRVENVHVHYEQFDRNGERRNPRENLDLAAKPVQVVPKALREAATKVADEQVARVERAAQAVRDAAEKAAREAREAAERRAAEARRKFEEGKEAVVSAATTVADAAGSVWRAGARLFGRG